MLTTAVVSILINLIPMQKFLMPIIVILFILATCCESKFLYLLELVIILVGLTRKPALAIIVVIIVKMILYNKTNISWKTNKIGAIFYWVI